jgi:hypothetical protein
VPARLWCAPRLALLLRSSVLSPPVSPHVSTCEPEGGGGARGAAALEESTKLSCFVVVVGVGITRWGLKRMDGAG